MNKIISPYNTIICHQRLRDKILFLKWAHKTAKRRGAVPSRREISRPTNVEKRKRGGEDGAIDFSVHSPTLVVCNVTRATYLTTFGEWRSCQRRCHNRPTMKQSQTDPGPFDPRRDSRVYRDFIPADASISQINLMNCQTQWMGLKQWRTVWREVGEWLDVV